MLVCYNKTGVFLEISAGPVLSAGLFIINRRPVPYCGDVTAAHSPTTATHLQVEVHFFSAEALLNCRALKKKCDRCELAKFDAKSTSIQKLNSGKAELLWAIKMKAIIGGGRGGGGRTHLLLALFVWSLTTHLLRDGAPFLLLLETPPTFGRSLRFLHILHKNCLLFLSLSCFAVCGHHLSPRIAIVFSLLSSLPNFSMSLCLISSSPLTHPVPPCILHILLSCESYSLLMCHTAHMCSHVLLPTIGMSLSSFW